MTLASVGGALVAGALVLALANLIRTIRSGRSGSLLLPAASGRHPSGVMPGARRRRRGGSDPGPRAGRRSGSTGAIGSSLAGSVAAAAVGLVVIVLGVGPAVVAVGGSVAVRAGVVRAARRRRGRQVDQAMPELIDQFVIAASAGHPVHRCVEVVAPRAPEPVRGPLAAACSVVARGAPLADGLHQLGAELGTLGPALTDALVAAQRTGAPLAPALRRVAATARDRRRRAAEEAARRLPVTLLFPLVCCVLPAFGLLAVVPLLAGSLGSLRP